MVHVQSDPERGDKILPLDEVVASSYTSTTEQGMHQWL